VSLITACNSALAKLAKDRITAFDGSSLEAQYCEQFVQELLDEMADWTAWPQLIERTSLALVSNDRAAEWLYAYALPTDLGEPIAIRKPEDDATALPELSPPYTLPHQDRYNYGFKIEGGKLYTNVENAIFVYSSDEMTAAKWTPKMRRAFIDEMAYRLGPPLGKLPMNKLDMLRQEALLAKLEAIADAENKNERRQVNHISDGEFARMGFLE